MLRVGTNLSPAWQKNCQESLADPNTSQISGSSDSGASVDPSEHWPLGSPYYRDAILFLTSDNLKLVP